ncbi:MAG: hypothetical protein ABSE42_07860 [Bryobacteraceae bacterium]|jgi:hypothetical protein
MKLLSIVVTAACLFPISVLPAWQKPAPTGQPEAAGDANQTRGILAAAVQRNPDSAAALRSYAEFLDEYGQPEARVMYARLLAQLGGAGAAAEKAEIARRLVTLDLLAGDGEALARDRESYRAIAGKPLPAFSSEQHERWPTVSIPGPMRSFARMAAISSDAAPENVLPALARNIVTNGYQASRSNETLEQTEYLKLLHRYLDQARELEKLAGTQYAIQVPNCDSPGTAELLRILGFRMRGGCGSEVVLETVNAGRAFLTTDSGFPVNRLEEALRTNRPFTYDFHPTPVPVMFGLAYWTAGSKETDLIEALISDPSLCRLYLGLSKLDPATAAAMHDSGTLAHLRAYAHVLDFFGGEFELRGGKAVVPGGARSAAAWGELVGVSPDRGVEFFSKLLAKDDGWLASLFDALARINTPVRDYLTDPARMKRFYAAVRGKVTSPGPARPVFRSNSDMMLLTTRLQIDASGKPHVPGNLEVWKGLFTNNPQARYDGKLTRSAATWKEPDDLLEALFGLCRKTVENEPLKIFMALTDIDRNRTVPLGSATVERLARSWHAYGSQFAVFSESPQLSDQSINRFLDTAEALTKLREPALRADAGGTFQALVSLWQILVRQQTIADRDADAAFGAIAARFAEVHSAHDAFDAGHRGFQLLLDAAPKPADSTAGPQERMAALLAGAAESDDLETRQEMEEAMLRILDAQHLIPLDTLFQLSDVLESGQRPDKAATAQLAKLVGRIAELPLPRAPLTLSERNAMGFGFWTGKHLEIERKLNLRLAIEKAAGDPARLKDLPELLAPLLRDSLLGLSYAFYAPPGAQVLYTNPVFVRSHDFIGGEGQTYLWRSTEPYGSGWPSNGGGRLVGSLSTLPYALAEAEENFLVPAQTQALIWGDLVPQMILSAKIPRWWNVTPAQMHWVGLNLRYGRELLAEAALDESAREAAMTELGRLAAPVRTAQVRRLIEQGQVKEAVDQVTPAELFWLSRDLEPARGADGSVLRAQIERLSSEVPSQVSLAAISRAFGAPKPTLATSYRPELLNVRTFPTLMGYSSRILAESWESNNLYWVALADELSLRPAQLNVRIPQWTQQLVEHIFASHLEDWPAVLRSLRAVGDDVREHARVASADQKAALQEFLAGRPQ